MHNVVITPTFVLVKNAIPTPKDAAKVQFDEVPPEEISDFDSVDLSDDEDRGMSESQLKQ